MPEIYTPPSQDTVEQRARIRLLRGESAESQRRVGGESAESQPREEYCDVIVRGFPGVNEREKRGMRRRGMRRRGNV